MMSVSAAVLLAVSAAQAEDNDGRGASQAGSSFALSLFQDAVLNDESDILCLSPYSASMALSMTANGAEGATRLDILSSLGFECPMEEVNEYNRNVMELLSSGAEGIRLDIANSIWVSDRFSLKGRFCRTLRKNYDAVAANLDFSDPASASLINAWCAENTAGRIDKIMESIDPNAVLYLLNALYFKGDWTFPFDPDMTRKEIFHGNNADTEVDFMHNTADLPYYTGAEGSAVELPYGSDGTFVMDIFLPADGVSAEDFVSGFDTEAFEALTGLMDRQKVNIAMPLFKAEYETSLNAILGRHGMAGAFTPSADFSVMSREPLMISEVRQKTFIEVNEEGSEAAAITSVSIMRASLEPEPAVFRADRPFVFVIRETGSGVILFTGIVRNLK